MTTTAELRKQKRLWMEDTVSENRLKKELKISSEDIKKLKPETKYGKTRYNKSDVSWCLKLKD